jgi:hypothetical protein
MQKLLRLKLTAVSIWFRGIRVTVFITLPEGEDGKVRAPASLVSSTLKQLGCGAGETFSVGA